MGGRWNRVRDPLHVFIEFDAAERAVIGSRPFQRLRDVHQLALTYLVYPGASHKRFEHSLGVMEVAGRIFDTVTRPENLTDSVRHVLPPRAAELSYWRGVLRMAALCHDLGHLPFSHAAEDLLPHGFAHEQLSRAIIESPLMAEVWDGMRPKPEPEDVVKLALGPKEAPDLSLDPWEGLLAEMVVGDVFGADRIDYLLRDSLHVGVAYGRFDHHQLLRSIRILPEAPAEEAEVPEPPEERTPVLGIERGGLESAEALLLARYQMFSQVYFHPTRLIYDQHLADFLRLWLEPQGGRFEFDPEKHLRISDVEVLAALHTAARNRRNRAHEPANRISERRHFRRVYEREAADVDRFPDSAQAIYRALQDKFGADNVKYADARKSAGRTGFPVRVKSDTSASENESDVLSQLPSPKDEYVYVAPEKRDEASRWLSLNKDDIITSAVEAEQE
jgi:uncharacterized protein